MKHLFIINPAAGGIKKKIRAISTNIKNVMDDVQEPYDIYITKAPLDACRRIKYEAHYNEPLRVYACGGDGTLNECVNGVMGIENAAVTQLPFGTGNDFLKMFGKEMHKFRDIRALVLGHLKPIDLIECNGRYCINICSVGIDARIGLNVHKYSHLPIIGGPTGYVLSLIVNLARGVSNVFTVDTGAHKTIGEYTLICACNGRFYGGGFKPMPDAMPDDGKLEFLIVDKVSRLKFIRLVGKYARGRYQDLSNIITHISGDYIEIASENEICANVDGERLCGKRFRLHLIPTAVNLIIPKGLKFFDARGKEIADFARN